MKPSVALGGFLTLGAMSLFACGKDSPSSATTTLTAPTPQSPASGDVVNSYTPTLTVANAQGGIGAPTYRFEVARDSGFANTVAAEEGIGQGASGTTSWQVPSPLEPVETDEAGLATFYWRARASASGEVGPYSPVANFKVQAGFVATRANANHLLVFDPLTNGTSVGEVLGGDFNSRGWLCTAAHTYIRYEVPTLTNGFVEFDVTGLREPNPHSDKRMLLIMWDPTRGEYTTNPFRVHVQKMDSRTVDRWPVRLRWITQGDEYNTGWDFYDWEPDRVYTWRMEWGSFPGLGSQRVRVLLDGAEIMVRNYDKIYRPTTLWIELGGAPRHESLEQAIYSNVRIGTR